MKARPAGPGRNHQCFLLAVPPSAPAECLVERWALGARVADGQTFCLKHRFLQSKTTPPTKDSHSNGTERQFRVKGPALTGSEEKILEEKGAPQEAFW